MSALDRGIFNPFFNWKRKRGKTAKSKFRFRQVLNNNIENIPTNFYPNSSAGLSNISKFWKFRSWKNTFRSFGCQQKFIISRSILEKSQPRSIQFLGKSISLTRSNENVPKIESWVRCEAESTKEAKSNKLILIKKIKREFLEKQRDRGTSFCWTNLEEVREKLEPNRCSVDGFQLPSGKHQKTIRFGGVG